MIDQKHLVSDISHATIWNLAISICLFYLYTISFIVCDGFYFHLFVPSQWARRGNNIVTTSRCHTSKHNVKAMSKSDNLEMTSPFNVKTTLCLKRVRLCFVGGGVS